MNAAEAVRYVERCGAGLPPSLRWLLLCLALLADERGEARPSRADLASRYGRSPSATGAAVDALASRGLVKVERAERTRQRVTLLPIWTGGPGQMGAASGPVHRARRRAPWWPDPGPSGPAGRSRSR